MADILTPDLCVIGGGAGGLAVATAAVAFSVPVVLIERAALGGEHLNTGGLPSKALLAAANRAALARHGQAFGVSTGDIDVDFKAVRRFVQAAVAARVPAVSAERLAGLGVRVIKGDASFKDRRTVVVGEIEIRARRFVIATGALPVVPAIPGLSDGPYFTSDTMLDLAELPARLIVLGAGRVGLELAQAFRRLGSEVTVLGANEPLAEDDPEAASIVLAQLEREGVVIKSGVEIQHVSHIAHSVALKVEIAGREEMIEGSHLLIAEARKAATEGLALNAAGIKHDASGIKVNRKLKTSNSRVYAIGDVAAGQLPFTQAATYHAGLVIRHAVFRQSIRIDDSAVPRAIYTEPELAQAGLTEAQARQLRLKFRLLRWPYQDNDRAHAEGTTHGHIKVLIDKKGKILGATIVGAQAGELIAMWSLAIAQGLNIQAMTEVILPYPTLSEIGKRVAYDFFSPNLTRSWVRRIIAWLRIFG